MKCHRHSCSTRRGAVAVLILFLLVAILGCVSLALDLGYLTVHAAQALATGTLQPGDRQFRADRLGALAIEGDNILLGKPFVFTEDNIDQFDF